MYHQGYGVTRDGAEALHWYRLAAEQGNAEAQFRLGNKYYQGIQIQRDLLQAYKWWDLAAAQGIEIASEALSQIETVMTREQIVEAKKLSAQFMPK
jgi:TPR repeat protein